MRGEGRGEKKEKEIEVERVKKIEKICGNDKISESEKMSVVEC